MARVPAHSGLRPNRSALLGLLVLMGLLPTLVLVTFVEHRQERKTLDRALAFEASEQAESLDDYFVRARSLTQVMASNPAFRQFYELPGSRTEKIAANGPALREASSALAYLEELFPDSIGEACFIDRSGPENARAVKGVIEPASKLSQDETGASFFAPAFASDYGEVFQSRPYLSPDTNEWVIANATPIKLGDGSKPGIVHFEITMESFRRAAAESSDQFDVQIVDAENGAVVLDSRYSQRLGGKLGRPDDRRYVGRLVEMRYPNAGDDPTPGGPRGVGDAVLLRGSGTLAVDGYPLALTRLDRTSNNANDWIVVALSRRPAASWLDSLSPAEIAMMLGAALLLVLAAASLIASQRDLRFAALNDSLTKLGNRRRLMADLEHEFTEAGNTQFVLALFDLDGFKLYNDTFGHPAGDALLARLAHSLERAFEGRGRAYRLGGDEFCLIAPLRRTGDRAEDVAARGAAALAENGEGFAVTASFGAVTLPADAKRPSEALRLADTRLYAQKASRQSSAVRQSVDVLTRVLAERSAELGEHLDDVARMSELVAERLDLSSEEIEEVRRAAAVHDIGKIAVPEAILVRPGPLTLDDWSFIRRHPVIGERILSAAPSLERVARIIRATHERVDGTGYPDGIPGEAIPLASQIIAVCDAFDAMTSDRPYRNAMSVEVALDELRRCSGSQFDPRVVDTVCALVADGTLRTPHLPESPSLR